MSLCLYMSVGTQTFVTSGPVTPQSPAVNNRPDTVAAQHAHRTNNCHVHQEGTLMDVSLQQAGAVPGPLRSWFTQV